MFRLSRFESYHPHNSQFIYIKIISGSSSVGRASAFQAEGRGFESRLPLEFILSDEVFELGQCSSGVEHFHGKEGVASSNLAIGSISVSAEPKLRCPVHGSLPN